MNLACVRLTCFKCSSAGKNKLEHCLKGESVAQLMKWQVLLEEKTHIFNFVVMYIRCFCSCPLLLTIFGTLPISHKSYKYHDKLVFLPSALHLPLVNLTSEMSYVAYAT